MNDDVDYDFTAPAKQAKPVASKTKTEMTVLEKLRGELSKKVRRPDIYLEVPERADMAIRYSPNVTQQQVRAWRRNAGEDSKKGMDATVFACLVLSNTCNGILLDNELVTDEAGEPLGFGSDEIMSMVGADRVQDCIRAIYVVEPHIEATALAVMEAAGFNDSVEQVDPTKTP
jgi:hypothetical protein